MEILSIIAIVVALGGVLFNFFKINKVAKENEYKNIINLQRKDISDFKEEIRTLNHRIENLNKVVNDLDISLIRSNAISLSFPFPFWYKSFPGRKMRLLNDEYCKVFKRCREDYIGKTDFDVWDKETAERFKITDDIVLNSQLGYYIGADENIGVENMIIIKWRIKGITNDEYYIAGISLPYKNETLNGKE